MKKIALLLFFASSVVAFAVDTYFVRPTGDVTSWSTQAIADPAQVLSITDISELTPYLGTSTKVFYLAKGIFTAKLLDETTLTSGYYLRLANGEKVYGGFSGTETTINLTTRALTDRDGNGNVEAWEFLNETIIDGQDGVLLGQKSKRLFGIENNAELNGLSIKDFAFGSTTSASLAGGPIFVGSYLKTNNGSAVAAPAGYDATTSGSLINCSIVNLTSTAGGVSGGGGQGGAAVMSNINSVINNCLFDQCQSNTYNSSMGGAVYVLGTGGQIKNSIFRNNRAYFYFASGTLAKGGAVYGEAYASSDMNLIIENSVFHNNSSFGKKAATGYGAAFRNDAVAGKRGAQLVNCTFSNNYNSTTTSGNIELINAGTLINCINYGGTNGFRANTTNANYYLDKCVSTVANLDMAANATSYASSIFDATIDFGFTRPTTFNGSIFPDEVDYESKIVEIRKANFLPSKATSYLAANYGLVSLPDSYIATTGSATVNITVALPKVDLNGNSRVMGQNTLGAYNFVAEGTVPTVAIRTTEGANVFSTNGSLVFQNCTNNLVTILTVDGKIIKQFKVGAETEKVSLSKGLYVVKVNDAFLKVFNR